MTVSKAAYVPPPEPVNAGCYLIGAMMCSLWKQGTLGANWNAIFPYPEREPLLGWYDEGDPEVTDWEIKWLLDHGVSFGVLCWFREKGNAGKPVKPVLDHWIKSLSECHYGKQFKYAVMWENGNAIASGVQSEADLIHNLLPFWIKNYFCQPNYLMIDGKPLLYIYRPEILTSQLGGEAKTRAALVKLRAACVRAGFKGLTILGENHSAPAKPVTQMVDIGLDASFSYHWPSFSGHFPADPTSPNLINAQADCWRDQAAAAPLPAVTTVSMGWDSRPWGRPFSEVSWHLPPAQFQQALVRAKAFMDQSPTNSLPGRMLLLDNWNEFGEGHYIFPTREFGFGYLDAVRDVFAPNAPPHRDLTPEDLGLGPYETALHTVTR